MIFLKSKNCLGKNVLKFPLRASPCEKSEEKGQRQKVKFVYLNMKEDKATGLKSTFLASLFGFL